MKHTETLLHCVWKHKLYVPYAPRTTDGNEIEIIDTGIYNPNAGPDFFNAKIKLDGKLWAGNIEIHTHSSDWYRHRHETNKAYNSVVLHVVEFVDMTEIKDESGRIIPQWKMEIPNHIKENSLYLLNNDHPVPCLTRIDEIPESYLNDWKNSLLFERLEQKANTIFELLNNYHNDWNEIFYIVLARNFGFGINSDAFERLAKSLPLKYVLKHSDSTLQTEALFLGQAGLLQGETIRDDYYSALQKEYQFLSKKYGLRKLESHLFKSMRMRPDNFPHIKIIQLSEFISRKQNLFSMILETEDIKDFQSLFISNVSPYWESHYHFGKVSPTRKKGLGLPAINLVLINTVVPLLFAYGKKRNQQVFKERALKLIETIKAENNYLVNTFTRAGIKMLHAGDSQSFIQLRKAYCEQKKCFFCRIGHKLLTIV